MNNVSTAEPEGNTRLAVYSTTGNVYVGHTLILHGQEISMTEKAYFTVI